MDKKELRKLIREKKKAMTPEAMAQESHMVFDTIEALQAFKNAQNILLYYSLPDELPTHEVVERWSHMKNVYLPRVNGEELDILKYDANSLKESDDYKIEEPEGAELIDPSTIDLVIVPAVGLDKHCHRMGRGKGFYDRLLPKCKNAYLIGVALNCQLLDEIPVEEFDINMCGVVTASHISFSKAYKK